MDSYFLERDEGYKHNRNRMVSGRFRHRGHVSLWHSDEAKRRARNRRQDRALFAGTALTIAAWSGHDWLLNAVAES